MPVKLIPQKIVDQYNLHDKIKNRHAGILANKFLKENLAKDEYFELPHTPGLWKHESHPIAFSLVVGDFGIKYT
ncbi:hypothetical protein ACHAWF_000166 [Thalassiosira exigua]